MDAGERPTKGRGSGGERACDQCKMRKVKCDMTQPCLQCFNKSLDCTYQRLRKKRGPVGKRIESIRKQQKSGLIWDEGEKRIPSSISNELLNYPTTQLESATSIYEDEVGEDVETNSQMYPLETATSQTSEIFHSSIDPGLMSHTQQIPSPASTQISNILAEDVSSTLTAPSLAPIQPMLPSLPVDSPYGGSEAFGSIFSHLADVHPATTNKWPRTVNEETILHWIDVYFKRLHPTIPILSRTNMYHEMLLRKHQTDEHYGAMLLSLSAFSLIQPVTLVEAPESLSRASQARLLIEECIKMRASADFGEHPTLEMVLTSFFLFACLFGNGQHEAAWLRLREATDLAQSLGIHKPRAYEPLDSTTREKWLRTYLVLSVTERAYALQKCRSIGFRGQISFNARFIQSHDFGSTTDATGPFSHLLSHEPSDTAAMTGLLFLAETFSAFDENIIECWNGLCKLSDEQCEWFDRRRALRTFESQHRARDMCLTGCIAHSSTSPRLALSDLAEAQQADLSVTHFWLLNRLWSLCLSHGLLRSTSMHPELRYDYACHIAKALWATCKTLPFVAMEVHGVGLAEKVYDIALSVVAALRLDEQLSPHTDLTHLGDSRHEIPLFDNEVSDVQSLLHGLSMLLNHFRGGDHEYGIRLRDALASIDA